MNHRFPSTTSMVPMIKIFCHSTFAHILVEEVVKIVETPPMKILSNVVSLVD